jgi:hypothetical protein
MANADKPQGFVPKRHLTGGIIRANEYLIANGKATNFFSGDIVDLGSDGYLDAFANTEKAIGVFYGVEYVDESTGDVKFTKKWTSGTTVKANTDIKAYVYDDPMITFTVQAGNGAITQANVGETANVLLTAGDSTYGYSKHELDNDTLATGALVLRVLRKVDEPDNTWAENAKVEVTINQHRLSTQGAGI